MIVRLVIQLVLVIGAAAACWALARAIGPWPALGVWAATTAAATVGAALLLRTSGVGRITWKNRLAGLLLPWGYAIARGKLPGIVATSWLVWMLIAVAACLLAKPVNMPPAPVVSSDSNQQAQPQPRPRAESRPWLVASLFVSWVIDGGALLYLGGVYAKNFTPRPGSPAVGPGPSGGSTLLRLVAFLVLLIAASVALWLAGRPVLALALSGGPPLLLGLLYGVFLVIILVCGRNARWN